MTKETALEALYDSLKEFENFACSCDAMMAWTCEAHKLAMDVHKAIKELEKHLK